MVHGDNGTAESLKAGDTGLKKKQKNEEFSGCGRNSLTSGINFDANMDGLLH